MLYLLYPGWYIWLIFKKYTVKKKKKNIKSNGSVDTVGCSCITLPECDSCSSSELSGDKKFSWRLFPHERVLWQHQQCYSIVATSLKTPPTFEKTIWHGSGLYSTMTCTEVGLNKGLTTASTPDRVHGGLHLIIAIGINLVPTECDHIVSFFLYSCFKRLKHRCSINFDWEWHHLTSWWWQRPGVTNWSQHFADLGVQTIHNSSTYLKPWLCESTTLFSMIDD